MPTMRDGGPLLTIGKAARAAGVSVRALRFYERRGLVRPASRTVAGYRLYSTEQVRRVRLVKWAQGLGFSLREVGLVVAGGHSGGLGDSFRSEAAHKVRELDETIARLIARRDALEALTRCQCRGTCPVVERAVTTS